MYLLVSIFVILACAAGYSAGAALRAGKRHVEPEVRDILGVAVLWTGAIVYRSLGEWNPAWTIVLWLAFGLAFGAVFCRPRRSGKKYPGQETAVDSAGNSFLGRAWAGWKAFARKMGHFQSRLIFSWVFFLLIGPFALIGRIFSDPLGMRRNKQTSFWGEKAESPSDLDAAGRQY
jgi:hypothetical protein